MIHIEKIVSGGQSGVERAALDFAAQHEIPYGGTVPQDGWAEDFVEAPGLLAPFPLLEESDTRDPRVSTYRNVEDSDATLIIVPPRFKSRPVARAIEACEEMEKPFLVTGGLRLADVLAWLDSLEPRFPMLTLNVTGPRASEHSRLNERTYKLFARIMTAE